MGILMRTIRKKKNAEANVSSFERRIFFVGKYILFLKTQIDIRERASTEINIVILLKPHKYEKIQEKYVTSKIPRVLAAEYPLSASLFPAIPARGMETKPIISIIINHRIT
jgi:hypothetical protein